jgi:hypothetical protein
MKGYGGVEVQHHTILTSALDGSVWSPSLPDQTTPEERAQVKVKVKIKFTLEQATKAQRGRRGIALLFH